MSYYLLWIEALLAGLLFAAMLFTIGLRRKTRKAAIPICIAGLVLPLLPLGATAAFAVTLRFVSNAQNGFFWGTMTLVGGYLAGAITLLVIGRRMNAAGLRRAFSWPLARITTSWLIVVALSVMTFWNLGLQAQVEIQALRAEAGALALSTVPPQIADSANAAFIYQKAQESFTAATIPADKDVDYRDLDPRSPEVASFLQRQQKSLDLVRRAADMQECRIEFDLAHPDIGKVLAEWPKYRTSSLLLAIAAKEEAANGKIELAMTDCRRLFSLARHVRSAPALIGGLAAISNDARASKTTAQALGAVSTQSELNHFPVPDLRELPHAIARSLRTEEAMSLALCCDMASGKGVYASGMSPLAGTTIWLAYLRDDIGIYRVYLQKVQRMAEQPYYQTVSERQEIETEANRLCGFMSSTIVSSLFPMLKNLASAQALRSSVVVACAATRYRLDRGEFPVTTQALIPGYLESIPTDPFDGQPIRIKRMPAGQLIIYSVGNDGKDDGGDVDSKGGKRTPADEGIILNTINKSAR